MERPALKALLADVDAGLVDVIVVYKIDRLTRSLPDFARIVERFDAQEVSFVSVTQAFNTTSSMGRLTLNVLLSFAQFEREVTGERIRDKIAASKAKGMWMGGYVPLGYDKPEPNTHTLIANQTEAETVRHIFARYHKLGSVHAEQSVQPKQRVTKAGRTIGGQTFSRGALFHLLRNPIYLGKIRHKEQIYDGNHDALIGQELFDRVQQQLDQNTTRHRSKPARQITKAPLTGKLFDANGEPMSPSFSRGKSGRSYRYYVSASLQQGGKPPQDDTVRRIAAPAIEKVVSEIIQRLLPMAGTPLAEPLSIHLNASSLLIDLPEKSAREVASNLSDDETIIHQNKSALRTRIPCALPLRGGERLIIAGIAPSSRPDRTLITALRRAHGMIQRKRGLPVIEVSPSLPHERKLLRLAFLAPQLQRDIMSGHQPPPLNLQKLQQIEIPLCWKQQRSALGWPDLN